MLDLVFENHTADNPPAGGWDEKFFRRILNIGIKKLKIKDEKVEISLNLVGDAKIRELNKKYRGKNKVTDVLSFPLNPALLKKDGVKETSLKNYGILSLGDIFICLPVAKKEAIADKMTLQAKLAQLTTHGFLHLLGYDHEISAKETKRMLSLENKILKQLNI